MKSSDVQQNSAMTETICLFNNYVSVTFNQAPINLDFVLAIEMLSLNISVCSLLKVLKKSEKVTINTFLHLTNVCIKKNYAGQLLVVRLGWKTSFHYNRSIK